MTGSHGLPEGFGHTVAKLTLVLAPLLAFRAVPVPGILLLGMAFPFVILTFQLARTPRVRFPGWELVLIGVLALSVVWGDDPNYSTERLRTYLPLVLATVVAANLLRREIALKCLKVSIAIMIGAGLVRVLLDPAGAFRGGTGDLVVTGGFSKNTFGAVLVIALLLLLEQRRRANLVFAPALVLLIVLNRSVTAWLVAVLLVAATYLIRDVLARMPTSTARPLMLVMVITGFGGAILMSLINVDSAVSAVGKDPTLGRRTDIWRASWEQVQNAPVLGHGAYTFLDKASGSPVTQYVWAQFRGYKPPHPHNGFLDLAGQVGAVGVVVFLALMVHAFRRTVRPALEGDSVARTGMLILAFILLFSVTEPTFLGAYFVITIIGSAIAGPGQGPVEGRPGVPVRQLLRK